MNRITPLKRKGQKQHPFIVLSSYVNFEQTEENYHFTSITSLAGTVIQES